MTGGLYALDGFVYLRNGSALMANRAINRLCNGTLCGWSYHSGDGDAAIYYALPAPPASYIMLTSDCRDESIRQFGAQVCPNRYLEHPELNDAIVAQLLDTRYDDDFPAAVRTRREAPTHMASALRSDTLQPRTV